jgi:DNA-binding MarR family transcriptional regulator
VLEKSTVSRDLRYLVRMGWIESTSGDDARKQHLTVTRQGLTVIDDAYPSWVEGQKAAGQLLGSVLAVATMEAADRYWKNAR